MRELALEVIPQLIAICIVVIVISLSLMISRAIRKAHKK